MSRPVEMEQNGTKWNDLSGKTEHPQFCLACRALGFSARFLKWYFLVRFTYKMVRWFGRGSNPCFYSLISPILERGRPPPLK
jgi:hypothetical protein